jgi:hypothetical protein
VHQEQGPVETVQWEARRLRRLACAMGGTGGNKRVVRDNRKGTVDLN